MALQTKQLTPRQQALRDLEEARIKLAHHAQAAADWSPQAVMARSFERHRALWIGGAVLAALALVKFLTPSSNNRRDNVSPAAKNHWMAALLVSPLVALARKAVLSHAAKWLEAYLGEKVSPNIRATERV